MNIISNVPSCAPRGVVYLLVLYGVQHAGRHTICRNMGWSPQAEDDHGNTAGKKKQVPEVQAEDDHGNTAGKKKQVPEVQAEADAEEDYKEDDSAAAELRLVRETDAAKEAH